MQHQSSLPITWVDIEALLLKMAFPADRKAAELGPVAKNG
jgi:hypothetical protein